MRRINQIFIVLLLGVQALVQAGTASNSWENLYHKVRLPAVDIRDLPLRETFAEINRLIPKEDTNGVIPRITLDLTPPTITCTNATGSHFRIQYAILFALLAVC